MRRPQDTLKAGWRRARRHITRKRLIIGGGAVLLILLIIPLATYIYFSKDIANRERLMNRNNTGFVLLDKHGETVYSFGRVNHHDETSLDAISDHLENALIATEDREFYNHDGYSLRGIAAAIRANVLNKDATRYGGSTITQQLVKNNLLSADKSFLRKYQELSMAIAVERHYTKAEILEMYLNSVYFGEGAFGVEDAARIYLNKSAADLTLAESSILIGILPAPSRNSPISGDFEEAQRLQARVLDKMVEAGKISQADKAAALAQPIAYTEGAAAESNLAPHFTLMVLDELKDTYGEEMIARSGFEVTTSLDLKWQKEAEQYVKERVDQLRAEGGTNASLVAIDPKTGHLRALVGSADWTEPNFGKVNMALSPRQPGSSFKPIYYTESMDKRLITPATILDDKPTTYGGTYAPENYDRRFRGKVSVRSSLAQSLNIPSVEVMRKIGPRDASLAAQRLGLKDVNEPEKYGLSLALGTAEARLLDMTNAYATFANGGNQFSPVKIVSIKDKYDDQVYESQQRASRVMSAQASFLISSILSDNKAREPIFGSRLTIPDREVAVKTGTTNDNRDAWTIGFTPSLAVGVWLGDNNNQPMSVAGASGAGPIWMRSMTNFLGSSPKETFTMPANIIALHVCTSNGLRAENNGSGTYEEFFIQGTEPTGKCNSRSQEQNQQTEEDDKKKSEEEEEEKERKEPEDDEKENEGGRGANDTPPTDPTQPPDDDDDEEESPSQPPPETAPN